MAARRTWIGFLTRWSLVALPAAASGQERPEGGDAKSVLLVTWDTTRSDRIGCYGHAAARTPCLDALAARGLTFDRAWAAAPTTLPSHATILTGTYPCAHGIEDNGTFQVRPEARLLAEAVAETGFKTGAFVASFVLDATFGLAQGFDVYDAPPARGLGGYWRPIERTADETAERALAWFDRLEPGDRFFAWVHFYDPHFPHDLKGGPAPVGGDAYDAEITACDRALARILERLRARGLDDGLLTVVTADHGESFLEHGEKHHSMFVYDATLRVPLVVAPPPPGVAGGTRIAAPVSLADLAPTLLDRLGISRAVLPDARTPPLPAGDDADLRERPIYAETFVPYHQHRWHPLRALIWQDRKYIEAPRPELYDLAADPRELTNLAADPSDLLQKMALRLAALIADHPPLQWDLQGELSSEDAAKLRALGYGTAGAGEDPLAGDLPDPKDRIGDADLKEQVTALLQEAGVLTGQLEALRTDRTKPVEPAPRALADEELLRTREAALTLRAEKLRRVRELAETLRAGNPLDPFHDDALSQAEFILGNYAAAIARLERTVLQRPKGAVLHFRLGLVYAASGRDDLGEREVEKAALLEPRFLKALRWLVQLDIAQGDWAGAAWWCRQIANCEGQTAAELAETDKARKAIAARLKASGGKARRPRPLADGDLVPEGIRVRWKAPADGKRSDGGKE